MLITDVHSIAVALLGSSDLSRPPQGGYNPPSFHATPQPSDVQRGYEGVFTGGVYVIMMEWVINVVKY